MCTSPQELRRSQRLTVEPTPHLLFDLLVWEQTKYFVARAIVQALLPQGYDCVARLVFLGESCRAERPVCAAPLESKTIGASASKSRMTMSKPRLSQLRWFVVTSKRDVPYAPT